MSPLGERKKAARAAALEARTRAHADGPGAARQASGHVLEAIGHLRDVHTVSAYLPIRNELDPRPAMLALFGLGYRICVPVIEGRGMPLRFRAWTPGSETIAGPYNVPIPKTGDWLEPDVLLVPLLAFDPRCYRLGYGGGFYDRTIHNLREARSVVCYGLAYDSQLIDEVPHEPGGDAHLDGVITESGLRLPA